jgi:hypothetical protein
MAVYEVRCAAIEASSIRSAIAAGPPTNCS